MGNVVLPSSFHLHPTSSITGLYPSYILIHYTFHFLNLNLTPVLELAPEFSLVLPHENDCRAAFIFFKPANSDVGC